MTEVETVAVIAAVEDALILAIPATVPISERIALVNDCRRDVARRLRKPETATS